MIFRFENITNKYRHLENKSKLIAMIIKTQIRIEFLTHISIDLIYTYKVFFFILLIKEMSWKQNSTEIIIAHYCGGSNASCRRKPKNLHHSSVLPTDFPFGIHTAKVTFLRSIHLDVTAISVFSTTNINFTLNFN